MQLALYGFLVECMNIVMPHALYGFLVECMNIVMPHALYGFLVECMNIVMPHALYGFLVMYCVGRHCLWLRLTVQLGGSKFCVRFLFHFCILHTLG